MALGDAIGHRSEYFHQREVTGHLLAMAQTSSIEWTNSTWNPVTGCDKVSPGCKFCYAERMARRLKAMGSENYRNGFELALHEQVIEMPLRWKKPQVIFVNSMSDLFHKDVPLRFIQKTFDVMVRAHWHQFQILTKRADRLAEVQASLPWPRNIWMGVSVETGDYVHRIHDLCKVPAAVRFLSVEPLLAPIPYLPLSGIDWVIAGVSPVPAAGRWKPIGYARSVTDASRRRSPSSSSNGEESRRSGSAGPLMAARGTRYRPRRLGVRAVDWWLRERLLPANSRSEASWPYRAFSAPQTKNWAKVGRSSADPLPRS